MLNDLNVSWLYQQAWLLAESNDRAGYGKLSGIAKNLYLTSLTLRHIFVSASFLNIPVQI